MPKHLAPLAPASASRPQAACSLDDGLALVHLVLPSLRSRGEGGLKGQTRGGGVYLSRLALPFFLPASRSAVGRVQRNVARDLPLPPVPVREQLFLVVIEFLSRLR